MATQPQPQPPSLVAVKSNHFARSLDIEQRTVDEDKRTVELSFSSNADVERWFGYERLKHDTKSVRLERLKQGGNVLFNHNWDVVLGVVDSVRVEGGKCRAVLRFADTDDVEPYWQKVRQKVLTNVSVGYIIHSREMVAEKDGLRTYEVDDWEPYEISIVPVPADISVGMGREFTPMLPVTTEQKEERASEPMNAQPTQTAPPVELEVVRSQAMAEANKAAQERVAEMMDLGTFAGQEALAARFIAEGKSPQDLRKAIMAERDKKVPAAVQDQRSPVAQHAQPKKQFRNLGEQLLAIRAHATNQGTSETLLAVDAEQRALLGGNTAIGQDGGFLLQPQFSAEILKKTYDNSPILSRLTPVPLEPGSQELIEMEIVEDSRQNGSRNGGFQVYWMGEGGEYTPSKPTLRPLVTRAHKLGGMYYLTDEGARDAAALSTIASEGFAAEMRFIIENTILFGSGTGEPKGFMDSALSLVTVAAEAGQPAGTVVVDNLTKMWSRMWTRSKGNAIWLISPDVPVQLIKQAIANQPVFLPPGGLSGQQYSTIFGRPAIETEYNNPLGQLGDIILVDLSQYRYLRNEEMESMSSIHVEFKSDQTAYKFRTRVGGQPLWRRPLTPFKGASTLSPFVTLAART